jgi:ribosome-binding factor A
MHNPHPGYLRHERVSELIRKELGELIIRELEFNGAVMTIVEVDVTKKIDYARVHVSVIPASMEADTMKILNSRRREALLLRKINIRPMPEIQFVLDHGMEKAAEIEKAFIDEERRTQVDK